jgi:glycosyltransferase involved in cell wall biosynthesis
MSMIKAMENTKDEVELLADTVNFSFLSMLIDLLKQTYLIFKGNIHIHNSDFQKFIFIGASPYPPDLIRGLKYQLTKNTISHIYFYHLPPHFWWKPTKRGIFRSILNSAYFSTAVLICKISGMHIVLNQPNQYKLDKVTVHKQEMAIELLNANIKKSKDIDVLYLGRVSRSKGLKDLIYAIKLIKDKYELDLVVRIAGPISDQRLYRSLQKRILRYDLHKSIEFIGKVSETEKNELFDRSKMFVFPSYEEGWSISVMEAASKHVPIVAYNLEAYSYLEGNFFACTIGSNNLVKGIIECLKNKDKTEKYVNEAYKLVCEYNEGKIVNSKIELFKSELTQLK